MPRKGVPAAPKRPTEIVSEPVKQVQTPDGYGDLGNWNPSDRYLFGTATEMLARRPEEKYMTPPDTNSPRFTPIRPGATGQSANEPGEAMRSYSPSGSGGNSASGHKYRRGRPLV